MAVTFILQMTHYIGKFYNLVITLFDKWYESQWMALSNTISILSDNHESLAVTTAAIKSHGSLIKLSNNKSLKEHKIDIEKDIGDIEDSIHLIKDMFLSMNISPYAATVYLTHLILASDNNIQRRNKKIDIANNLVDAWSNYISYFDIENSGSVIEKGYKNYTEIYKLEFQNALNELLPKTESKNCLSAVVSYQTEHRKQEEISQILHAAEITKSPPVTTNIKSVTTKTNNKPNRQKILG